MGSVSFQPEASSQAELGVPLLGPNVFPRAEGHQPACSPVQKLSIAVVTASAVGAQEGRQQLLLPTASTNAHLLFMVVSECLIKSSVGHVRATQMVKSSLWIYKMSSLKNCLRLGYQSKSFFGCLIFFLISKLNSKNSVCYVLQK